MTSKEWSNFRRRAKQYGITAESLFNLLSNNDCHICGKRNLKGRDQCVDHDHLTGRVRGLLCRRCNISLGWIEKNLYSLHVFARYAGHDLKKIIENEENYKNNH